VKLSDVAHINYSQIKNIIFDWGGVLTNIDFNKASKAFHELGFSGFDDQYTLLEQNELFQKFEKGKISPGLFRDEIRKFIPKKVTDKEIDDAWMAILVDTPEERLEVLKEIKSCYRTFLLSNTNAIHVENYFNYLKKIYGLNGYYDLFEKVYLSYELGMRKPDAEIFTHVLTDNNLNPNETLLIDDSPQNIESAKGVGLQVYYLKSPQTIIDLFKHGTN